MTISISPQWIAKMYAGKPGRDHLGLGSVSSDQILPSLSPSINVLTFHPRYHSFYAFLLDEYWQRVPEKSLKHWKSFYRPREYIFSLGVYLHESKHGGMANIVGGQKTSPLAFKGLKSYPSDFDYIDSDLGGYGLYYRTVMAELELVYLGEQATLPLSMFRQSLEEKSLPRFESPLKTQLYVVRTIGTDRAIC